MRKFLILLVGLWGLVLQVQARGQDRSLARLQTPLNSLNSIIKSAPAGQELEALLEKKGRDPAFSLEGLLDIYKGVHNHAKRYKKTAKAYEDLIGSCTDNHDWSEFLSELPGVIELKSKVAEYLSTDLKAREEAARKTLEQLTKEDALAEIEKGIAEWDFGSYEADRETILTTMSQHLKEIEAKDYDLSLLEGPNGIHEFRRDIRAFLIQARALDGLLVFGDQACPSVQFKKLLTEKIAEKEYNKLVANAAEKRPCALSQCLYLGLSKLSDDLSAAKDIGQGEAMLYRYYRQQGQGVVNAQQSAESLTRFHPRYVEYQARAKNLRQQMLHSDLLKLIRQELNACIKK